MAECDVDDEFAEAAAIIIAGIVAKGDFYCLPSAIARGQNHFDAIIS